MTPSSHLSGRVAVLTKHAGPNRSVKLLIDRAVMLRTEGVRV